MVILQNGLRVGEFAVSTSRFGLGNRSGSYATPLGTLQIAQKIGAGAPMGSVFKSGRRTGEILRPNTRGRDPIVTRIMWLRGMEACNARTHGRRIYIHGTPQESLIGRPASFGCIRMRSRDVVRAFNTMPVGTRVEIINSSISRGLREVAAQTRSNSSAS